ncbi:MAG: hypothetical protein KAS72_01340 [Phycisphaerales bacterium]|nr:hypothetical protein [Phycisphaerales bacterium]
MADPSHRTPTNTPTNAPTDPPADATVNPSDVGETGSGAADEVLDMIADMEGKLGRLKEAKAAEVNRLESITEHEQQLQRRDDELQAQRAKLDEQADELAKREQTFTQKREAAAQQQDQIDQAQAALTEEREQLSREKRDAAGLEERLAEQEAEMQGIRDELAQAHSAAVDQEADLETAATEITKANDLMKELEQTVAASQQERETLAEKLHDLSETHSQRQGEITNLQKQLAEAQRDVEQAGEARQTALDEVQTVREELASVEAQLEQTDEAVEAAKSQQEDAEGELIACQAELEETQHKAQAERQAAQNEIETARAQLSDLQEKHEHEASRQREKANQHRSELEAATARTTELDAQLAEAHEARELADRSAEERESELAELRRVFESTAAEAKRHQQEAQSAHEMLDQQKTQFGAAKEKLLSFAKLIDEQADATEQVVELSDQLAQQQHVISELRQQLDSAGSSTDEVVETLRKQIAERDSLITKLKAKAVSRRGGPSEELFERQLEDRDARIEELEREARQTHAQLTERADIDADAVDALRTKIRELEAKAEQVIDVDVESLPDELAKQASRVKEATLRVERRRSRLKQHKTLLADQSEKLLSIQEILQTRHQQYQDLLAQRGSLENTRRTMAQAEGKLIAKWARTKGLIVGMVAMLILCALAAISYTAAMRFAPAMFSASAVLRPETKAGLTITSDDREAWAASLQSLSVSDQVLRAAADRMGQRGYIELDEIPELKAHFKNNLHISAQTDGMVRVEMRADRTHPVDRVLDTYVVSLIQVANATREQRSGDLTTKLSSAPAKGETPVSEEQLIYAGAIFGGLVFMTGLVCLGVRRSYAKAKPMFDADSEVFEGLDESHWPTDVT